MPRKPKSPEVESTAIVVSPAQNAGLAKMEDWELELAESAAAARANESSGVQRIVHKNSIISIDGKPVKDNKLRLIIIAYNFSKAFYPGAYDPKKLSTPVCYAFGSPQEGEKALKPHEQSPDKQHDQCAGCEHNRFGTALQGKGKRCKDERRVLCIVENTDPASIKSAEVRLLSVPPASLKNWGSYLDAIKDVSASGSPTAVVTELSTEARAAAYALTFKPVARLSKDQAVAAMARGKSEESKLYQAWPEVGEEEAAPAAPARSARASAKLR